MARRGENIYKRQDGRWEGRYKSGVKEDGTTKYSSIYGKSYAEVKALLSEKRIKTTVMTIPCNLTLNNLFELWFSDIKLKVKESTYANYRMKYEKHVKPTLGSYAYKKITTDKLNDFIQAKLASGLSGKYAADIAGVIKSVCRFAKKRFGYDDKSEFITMPKGKAKEKGLLGKAEQTVLNNYLTLNPTVSNAGILLSAATGIRIGELCALKWENIDLEKRTLTVRNTVQRIKNIDGSTATKLILAVTFFRVREIAPNGIYKPMSYRFSTAIV